MIGRRKGKSREASQNPIDPMNLPQPTNEEIVSVLVGQKDIFPVLESILKLIAQGAQPTPAPPPRPTGFEKRPSGSIAHECGVSPPFKKRKLNRVPAGAIDWDVPFPFADGEGPSAYHQTWERDRGKQLVTELIKLIKVAARKAAAKKYMSQQKRKSQMGEKDTDTSKNVSGYYRPETALYGLQGRQLESGVMLHGGNLPQLGEPILLGSGQLNQATSSSPLSTVAPTVPSQQSLDQLLSSFMPPSVESDLSVNFTIAQPPATSAPLTTDKNAFDTWMNILEAFPIDFGGTGAGTQVPSNESTPLSVQTPEVNAFPIPSDLDALLNAIMETPSTITAASAPMRDNLNLEDSVSPSLFDFTSITPNPSSTSVQDFSSSHSLQFNEFASEIPAIGGPVDALFAMSSTTEPSIFLNQNAGTGDDLTQLSSPLPSASSESQAVTPASAHWDLSLPDIFIGSSCDEEGPGMWRLWSMFNDVTQPGSSGKSGGISMDLDPGGGIAENNLNVDFPSIQRPPMDKGKAKEVVEPTTMAKVAEAVPQPGPVTQSAFNALPSTKTRDELLACITGSSFSPTGPSTPAAAKTMRRGHETESERQRRKEDIIRRAKERRQEIQENLNNVKHQLWETTIEQAALIQLTRKLEAEGDISSEAGQR
jgi:hypothetical protein